MKFLGLLFVSGVLSMSVNMHGYAAPASASPEQTTEDSDVLRALDNFHYIASGDADTHSSAGPSDAVCTQSSGGFMPRALPIGAFGPGFPPHFPPPFAPPFPPHAFMGMPPMAPMFGPAGLPEMLFSTLSLTDDQMQKLMELHDQFREQSASKMAELESISHRLMLAYTDSNLDKVKISGLQSKADSLKTELRSIDEKFAFDRAQVLEPEQRQKLRHLLMSSRRK